MKSLENPISAFLSWFRDQPPVTRVSLARLYLAGTTTRSENLALDGLGACRHLEFNLIKPDFPLRVVSRLVTLRALIDFIFYNRQILREPGRYLPVVVNLSDKQWESAAASWRDLRRQELADEYLQLWLKSEIQNAK